MTEYKMKIELVIKTFFLFTNKPNLMSEEHDSYAFVHQSMLTCIGNKRKLVDHIMNIILQLKGKIGSSKIKVADPFAGSSVVARALASVASHLYVNDYEVYSYLMAKCFLVTPSKEKQLEIAKHIHQMNQIAENGPYTPGIITKLYAPKDTNDVKDGERCFYTHENAIIIDTLRTYIDDIVDSELQVYCLVPLLIKASIHTNTAGVFKGFYKDENGIGCFGGRGRCALSRIMQPIRLDLPVWSDNTFNIDCGLGDASTYIDQIDNTLDIIYLDPPYNQHPYGSNYFMLNVIAQNSEPCNISKVAGIPEDWQKSLFNQKTKAAYKMQELLEICMSKTKYVVLSYNDEGIISNKEWEYILAPYSYDRVEITYDTYKGSRNLKNRDNKVMERIYIIGHKGLETVEEND